MTSLLNSDTCCTTLMTCSKSRRTLYDAWDKYSEFRCLAHHPHPYPNLLITLHNINLTRYVTGYHGYTKFTDNRPWLSSTKQPAGIHRYIQDFIWRWSPLAVTDMMTRSVRNFRLCVPNSGLRPFFVLPFFSVFRSEGRDYLRVAFFLRLCCLQTGAAS